jgi:hypothetical protein
MGASSNFGNMFSVLGASVFVPFLPMRPSQILANNLLYDVGQAAIPTDAVDTDRIQKPRAWNLNELTRFILFIGPCSSIFDYSTDEQNPVPAEPAFHVPAGHERDDYGDRCGPALLCAGPLPRVQRAAGALLAVYRADALCYVLLTQGVEAWLLRHGGSELGNLHQR